MSHKNNKIYMSALDSVLFICIDSLYRASVRIT